jgi:IclR family acetate operon transcriptional repressor
METGDRTAQVLALVLERSPRTMAELGGDEAAVDALVRHGLLEWDAGRAAVRPGPVVTRYARSGQDRQNLAALAEPAMRRLADESGETVNLMVQSARGAEAISQVDGPHVLGVSNWVGREVPDHCSAAGKVFLAFGTAELPPGPLERRAARTIVDHAALERELEAVRAHGYATIVDELEVGLAAVAAPVRDAGGAVVAALSVAGPTARLAEHRLGLLGRGAIEQAHTVSTRLGFEGALEDLLDGFRAGRT